MSEHADVVIVGGGPAGTVTAIALVRADPSLAERIVLLEKAHYPREKPCAGAIGGRGDRILSSLGARPDVPGVPIQGMSFRAVEGEVRAEMAQVGRVIRRIEFDQALARIARSRGIRIVEGAKVDAVEAVGDRAIVTSSAGAWETKVVVGADGVGSVVRKAMGLGAGTLRAQVLELDTEMVPSDRSRATIHFDASDRGLTGYYWDFPTLVDGRQLMCRGIYHLRVGDQEVDLNERLGDYLARIGLNLRGYKTKRFAERGLDFDERLSEGPMMLAGEAAGIDPISGEGIAQSVEYGALAGPFIERVLAGRESLDRWTSLVHRSRLGLDLRVRRRLVNAFFGPRRPEIERLLLDDAALRCGCRHFGALRQEPVEVARVLFALGKLWMGGPAA